MTPDRSEPPVLFVGGRNRRRWPKRLTWTAVAGMVGVTAVAMVRSDRFPVRIQFGPPPESTYVRPGPVEPQSVAVSPPAVARVSLPVDTTPRPPVSAPAPAARTPAAVSPPKDTTRRPAKDTARPPVRVASRPKPAPRPVEPVAPPEPGRLFVSSRPWGWLFVDGKIAGNTPKANYPLPPGDHFVQIVRDGYRPLERHVFVGPGQEIRLIDLVLESMP